MACEQSNQEWKFILQNENTDEMRVSDELLDSFERAKERADSEFLKNGYSEKRITFRTYLDDISINDIINIQGLPYLVKGVSTSIDATKLITTVTGVRYE